MIFVSGWLWCWAVVASLVISAGALAVCAVIAGAGASAALELVVRAGHEPEQLD